MLNFENKSMKKLSRTVSKLVVLLRMIRANKFQFKIKGLKVLWAGCMKNLFVSMITLPLQVLFLTGRRG